MKYLVAHCKGKTLKDLIVSIDCVAARLERNELSDKVEAPDKSGGLNFTTSDDKLYGFDSLDEVDKLREAKIKRESEVKKLKETVSRLEEENKSLSETLSLNNTELDDEMAKLKKENAKLKNDLEKAKEAKSVAKPKPKPKPKPKNRIRAY